MKVTRLGYPQPILNSGTGLNAGGRVPPGGNDLTVLTSNGSNGRYWGENVRRITANGSNTLQGPDVNFASGSNITFSISSNTLTIHGQAGGSGSLTVKDEGSTLSTAADTLDFVGAGVTASGTGGTKTITIPGGGSSTPELLLDVVPSSPDADDDEFTGSSLDAAWTNPGTSAAGQTNTITVGNGWMIMEPATAGTGSTGKNVFFIRKNSPSGSFTVFGKVVDGQFGADVRPGIFVAVSTGKAHVCGPDTTARAAAMALGVTTYSQTADWSTYDGFYTAVAASDIQATAGHMGWYRIRWDASATTLYFDYSFNGVLWRNFTSRSAMTQPDRMGICLYSNSTNIPADRQMAVGWFRVIDGSAAF